jgi:hypothetical protein
MSDHFLSFARLQNAERFINVDVDFPVDEVSSDLTLFNRFGDVIILKLILGSEGGSGHVILEEFSKRLYLIHHYSPDSPRCVVLQV